MNDDSGAELLVAIRHGVDAAISVADDIETGLLDCSKRLPAAPSKEIFAALSTGIGNVGDLVALMQEIRKGCSHLKNPPVPSESVASFTKLAGLLREMQVSMERKDWIVLASLIQGEFSLILGESKRELLAVRDCLAQG